jgi:hypothetical protein
MHLSKEPLIELDLQQTGLTLRDYATTRHLTENQVWEMIEDGNLSARFLNDNIFVFQEAQKAPFFYSDKDAPIVSASADPDEKVKPTEALSHATLEEAKNERPDVSLPDPLKVGYDQTVFEKLLTAKDDLIYLKDEKIIFLEEKIQHLEIRLKQLQRELENYATLHKITSNPNILRSLLSDD